MNKTFGQYKNILTEIFEKILAETGVITEAAGVMARSIAGDGIIHVIGPGGHSI